VGGRFRSSLDSIAAAADEFQQVSTAFQAYCWLHAISPDPKASSALPEVIICDWELADGNALELQERLQVMPDFGAIPFVVVSQEGSREQKREALLQGVAEWYHPPFAAEALAKRLAFITQTPLPHRSKAREETRNKPFQISPSKRALDLLVSSVALILLFPLLLVIALFIKLGSQGSVLQQSWRAGTGYQVFRFYKFRTLHPKTNKLTGIGSWLQRSNLDELPQLIHILRGNMSLVGNRPLPLEEAEQLTTDQWAQRFLAPVGITGLWQLARRTQPKLSEDDRRKLEAAYANEASLTGDLRILFRTIIVLIRKPH